MVLFGRSNKTKGTGEEDVAFVYDESKDQRAARLKKYRRQVEESLKWRSDNYDPTWRDMINLYRNKPYEKFAKMDYPDLLALAIGFSTINVIYPSVSLSRPKVTVTATHPDFTDRATVVEAVVNYWWRHFDYQTEYRQAVKDFLIIGHGWTKTTYLKKEQTQQLGPDEYRQNLVDALQQKYQAIEERPQDESLFPSNEDIAETLPTTKKIVTEDHPVVERVSPFDMIVDPDATRDFDLRWIAQRIAVPKAEAKARDDWDPKVRDQLVASAKKLKESDGFYDDQIDKGETYVIVYEHYDLTTGYLCTFADNGDDFLKDPQQIPFPFGHPFVMLRNYEVPEQFYPIGELEMIEPLVMEESFMRTRQMNDVRQYTRKFGTKAAWVDSKAINALKSTADGEIIMFDDSAPDDLRTALVAMPTMDPNPTMYQMSSIVNDDITRISAVSEYQQGVQPDVRRTATEAGIIQDASNSRAAEKLTQIELGVSAVARRIIQLGQTMLTSDQVVRIGGQDPNVEVQWVPFDRDAIVGEYDFEVEAGSTQPRNETFRRQSAIQMMDAFSNPLFQPQPQPDGTVSPIIDARKLAEYVMREGFGIKNAADFIVPEAPPLNPELAQGLQTLQPGQMPPDQGGPPPEGGTPPPEAPPQQPPMAGP